MQDIQNISRSQSYLAYMNFAHVLVTSARLCSVSPNFDGIPTDAAIIPACLHEASELGSEEDTVCEISTFNYVQI